MACEGPPRDEGTPEIALLPLYSLPSTIVDKSSSAPSGLLSCFNSYVTAGFILFSFSSWALGIFVRLSVSWPVVTSSDSLASPVDGGFFFLRFAFSLSAILLSSSEPSELIIAPTS